MKFIFSLMLFLPAFVFASLQDDFTVLKNNGRNLQDTGAICEEVAQLNMQKKFPVPQYVVLSGITYSDRDGTIGELDIVVFEKNSRKAVVIAEVKCWKDVRAGLVKAYDQQARFVKSIRSSQVIQFKWLSNPTIPITKDQFTQVQQHLTIAQKGSSSAGFDLELPYSLQELMELRHSIIRCQSAGQCKRPLTSNKDF